MSGSKKMKETVDNNERSSIEYVLDEDRKIKAYKFIIYTKDKNNISGTLSRDEMEKIFGMYSRYGSNLSQAVVYQEFPRWSYVEFQRILRALQITKNGQLPEHLKRELSQDEQEQYYKNLRAANARRNFDAQRFKYLETDYKKLLFEHEKLKNSLENFRNIQLPDVSSIRPYDIHPNIEESSTSLMLHLSDWHIGAAVSKDSLYGNTWNKEICRNRLDNLVKSIIRLNIHFDYIVINNLGDCLDGMDGMTARRDHVLPQNMNNKEQIETFVSLFIEFINKLKTSGVTNHIKIYSVPNGNHCGITEYYAIEIVRMMLGKLYPDITFVHFNTFFGYYSFNGLKFLIMHGKDEAFMKKPFPLNLTSDTKCRIEDYLASVKFPSHEKIHVVKGDLHTANLNSDYSMDYRNVLSLFGASDYSERNYTRSDYGTSYSLIINNNIVRGEFTEL